MQSVPYNTWSVFSGILVVGEAPGDVDVVQVLGLHEYNKSPVSNKQRAGDVVDVTLVRDR